MFLHFEFVDLPFSTSEDFLKREFSAFGEIAEGMFAVSILLCFVALRFSFMALICSLLYFKTVKLIKDEAMKRSKGYAFIQFTSQDDAFLAIETMDRRVKASFNHKFTFLCLEINLNVSHSSVADVQWQNDLYRHCETR